PGGIAGAAPGEEAEAGRRQAGRRRRARRAGPAVRPLAGAGAHEQAGQPLRAARGHARGADRVAHGPAVRRHLHGTTREGQAPPGGRQPRRAPAPARRLQRAAARDPLRPAAPIYEARVARTRRSRGL
ncbi:MAG: hypothetical protein AVDCRST_MAG40-3362, partial [uncultured Gemmatimonadaceae bacterium]